ncbi:MAG TPA: hypothetical protein ENF99_01180, partial [Candidatus Aenigmarchaeota archaeon]|nr:hypothetical protein [Candidatus Aenigmarchaeota archaeon]
MTNLYTQEIEREINDSIQYALQKRGILGWIRSLFNEEESEAVAKEAVADLKRKGLLEEARNYLSKLDELPEWDPSAEAEARKREKEFRKTQITLKILDELPHVKVVKKKLLGIVPRYHVTLNPGYEEFFHNHLGDYTRSEIYSVLQELEAKFTGKNKEKIQALRKEFEKREGISRNKKIAIIIAGILLGAAAGYGLYSLFHKKPNPVLAYLIEKKKSDEYALFKPLDSDGIMQPEEKALIDYFNTLPSEYRNKKEVLSILGSIVSDGRVTAKELNSFKDPDSDGLDTLYEIEIGTDPFKPNPNVAFAVKNGIQDVKLLKSLFSPLDSDGVMQSEEKAWDKLIVNNKEALAVATLLSYLSNQSKDGKITSEELSRADNFTFLVKEMYNVIKGEDKAEDKLSDADYSAKLGLKLGFDKTRATEATAKAIAEYAVAVKEEGLPEQLDALQLLTEGTQNEQYGEKLVDFSPIVFHSVDGNDYVLEIDKPRNTWMLAKQMYLINQTGFPIIKHPEVFEGLNGKIIANAYSLFDAKYGISYMEKEVNNRTITPTDEDVWDLIMLQWKLYSDKAFNKSALYN